jgi:nickel/cobalt exporter
MSAQFSAIVVGVVSVSVIHSLVPHHWLPFVVVGRRQGWNSNKVLTLLGVGALVHMLSTIAIGLLVGYLGHQIDQRFETFHGIVPGLILIAFGGGYLISSVTHKHHEVSERVAASSLIILLGLSPCVVVAPFFLILGPLGWVTVVKVCIAMSVLSVAGMTLCGWIALKGLNVFKLEWLEENETRVMGVLLMLLGMSFIIF